MDNESAVPVPNVGKPKLKELAQTCGMYPSQWEGETADGQHVYIRYRGGWLSVGVGNTPDAAVDDEDTFGIDVDASTGYDGIMEESEMMDLTASVLDWSDYK
jgi:hypothetical protein